MTNGSGYNLKDDIGSVCTKWGCEKAQKGFVDGYR